VTGESGDHPAGSLVDGIPAAVQRWLIRSSAENMRREMGDQFRRAFGGGRDSGGDAWDTATTEPPPESADEAPECAWCPVCRTARRIRESGSGLGGLSGAGDAVASAVQEALSAFDAFLSVRPRTPGGPDHEPDSRS
jgi:hypothetical protein